MYYLIMTYCMMAVPCKDEVVAIFPQWDVGHKICDISRKAIELEVAQRVSSRVKVTYECVSETDIP